MDAQKSRVCVPYPAALMGTHGTRDGVQYPVVLIRGLTQLGMLFV